MYLLCYYITFVSISVCLYTVDLWTEAFEENASDSFVLLVHVVSDR